jgi:hypothetical protein
VDSDKVPQHLLSEQVEEPPSVNPVIHPEEDYLVPVQREHQVVRQEEVSSVQQARIQVLVLSGNLPLRLLVRLQVVPQVVDCLVNLHRIKVLLLEAHLVLLVLRLVLLDLVDLDKLNNRTNLLLALEVGFSYNSH